MNEKNEMLLTELSKTDDGDYRGERPEKEPQEEPRHV